RSPDHLLTAFSQMPAKNRVIGGALLREIVGNPFRPIGLDASWLAPPVPALAEAAYQQRVLPVGHLDPLRLAVLSDAMQDAGCYNDDVLTHLRRPGPHVRGCFLLDALLAKE